MKANVDVSKLLDELRLIRGLQSDAALARELEVAPCTISKLRAGMPLGASTIVRISERYDLTAKEIYYLGGQSAPQQYHDNPTAVSETAAHQ